MPESQPQKLFPSILRFITEKGVLLIISLVSLFVLAGIGYEALKLHDTLQHKKFAEAQRLKLSQQLAYWQDIVRQYGNYRDAYFKIATIQYQLGETAEARQSIQKVLTLDPNFKDAHVLGAKITAP